MRTARAALAAFLSAAPVQAAPLDLERLASRFGVELALAPASPPFAVAAPDWDALEAHLARAHPEIPAPALRKAFAYARTHPPANASHLVIVDFSRPSTERRMSVIRTADGFVQSLLVAHGEGSGVLYAKKFSDTDGSHQSSLGLYLTGVEYYGDHGRSLKLHGLEESNRSAFKRYIVVHGADYVSEEYIAAHGYLGQSWGCPAVELGVIGSLVDRLKGGSVFLIYR